MKIGFIFLTVLALTFAADWQKYKSLIEVETDKSSKSKIFENGDDPSTINLKTYHNLTEINAFINSIAKKHNSIASIFNIGKSFQKRDILGIKIGNPKNEEKKAVLLHSLIHSREWITGATTIKLIYELLETDKYAALLDIVNFYIIPVFNVDGYEYTWTTDRMWRKSLSGPYNEGAIGVDLNRNFDWNWSSFKILGNRNIEIFSSAEIEIIETFSVGNGNFYFDDPVNQNSAPSDDTFSGLKAFSEIEDQNLKNFVEKIQPFSYWDFHSCSGDFFFPDGIHTLPINKKYLKAGKIFVDAAADIGDTGYKYCEPDTCIYNVTGDTMDYFFFKQNVTFSFATEIGPCTDGFEVPESKIQNLTDEFLAGFFAVINFLTSLNDN